jgi:hypothetical protein
VVVAVSRPFRSCHLKRGIWFVISCDGIYLRSTRKIMVVGRTDWLVDMIGLRMMIGSRKWSWLL